MPSPRASASPLILGAALAALATAASAVGAPSEDDATVERDAREVYDRVVAVLPPGRPAPAFSLSRAPMPAGLRVAAYQPDQNLIILDRKAYDVCARIAPHEASVRQGALALILGHELAHFVRGEGWDSGFLDHGASPPAAGAARADEEFADYEGGMYAYIAGYEPFAVVPRLVDDLYADLGLPPGKTDAGPLKRARLLVIDYARRRIQEIAPWLSAAKLLMVAGRPLDAARLFDHVAAQLPSREILVDAGVAWAEAGVAAMRRAPALRAPLELAWDERAMPRPPATRGPAGPTVDARVLLERARQLFSELDATAGGDLRAEIDLACVYALLGEADLAEAFATRALARAQREHDEASAGHALVARAFAEAQRATAGKAAARRDLEAAARLGSALAALDLRLLDGARARSPGAPGCVPGSAPDEEPTTSPAHPGGVRATTARLVLAAGHSCRADGVACPRVELAVETDEAEHMEHLRVDVDGRTVLSASSTGATFSGASSRGVRRGSPTSALAPYGCPTRVLARTGGEVRVHQARAGGEPALVEFDVTLGGQGAVVGWSVIRVPDLERR